MQGTAEAIQKCANKRLETSTEKHGIAYQVCIVSVSFYAMRYLNSTCYLPENNTPRFER